MNLLINFKKLSGDPAIKLAERLNMLDEALKKQINIYLAISLQDAEVISSLTSYQIVIQDTYLPESENIISYLTKNKPISPKIVAAFVNHPDNPDLVKDFELRRKLILDTNLRDFIVATNDEELKEFGKKNPFYMGYEFKELIGKDLSVRNTPCNFETKIKLSGCGNLFFGGGIKDVKDLEYVNQNGGKGVMVSSAIVKSEEPLSSLNMLLTDEKVHMEKGMLKNNL